MNLQDIICSVYMPEVLPQHSIDNDEFNCYVKDLIHKYIPGDIKVIYYENYNLVITINNDLINFYSIYLPNNTVVRNIHNIVRYPSYTVLGYFNHEFEKISSKNTKIFDVFIPKTNKNNTKVKEIQDVIPKENIINFFSNFIDDYKEQEES